MKLFKRINNISAGVLGFLVVLPFAALEFLTDSGGPRTSFPIPLFIVMWITAAIFIKLLSNIIKNPPSDAKTTKEKWILFAQVVIAAFIAFNWVGLVIDQWSCFLGASGC